MSAAEAQHGLSTTRLAEGASRGAAARRRGHRLLRACPAPACLLLGDVLTALLVLSWQSTHPLHLGAVVLVVVCFWIAGLYRSRLSISLLNDFPYLVLGVGAVAVLELAAAGLVAETASGTDTLRRAGLLLAGLLLVRGLAYSAVRGARRRGLVRHTALMLGAGDVGIRLARTLQEHGEYGLEPVGFVDSRPRVQPGSQLPAPLVGGYDNLADLILRFDVRVAIVAFGSLREEELVGLLRTCDRLRCEIFFIPRLFEMSYVTRDMDQAWGIPLVRVRRAPYRKLSWVAKRVVDVAVSGVALLLLSPLLAACALAVRLEGGPGVLFRQERVGLDGRSFTLLKFRSLKPVADEESATRWNIAHDSRLGPVGRFLRRSSLDELPQLWNILTGSMSLVGPRPERPHFVEEFRGHVPRYMARHRVPAGLTGWAQVHGLRGDTSIESRAGFDNFYIENWSLWGDVKILLRTVDQVVRARGG